MHSGDICSICRFGDVNTNQPNYINNNNTPLHKIRLFCGHKFHTNCIYNCIEAGTVIDHEILDRIRQEYIPPSISDNDRTQIIAEFNTLKKFEVYRRFQELEINYRSDREIVFFAIYCQKRQI